MRTDDIGCHHQHDGSFHNIRPEGAGDWLLVLFHTPCDVVIDGQEYALPENSCIIYTSTFPQDYRARDDVYIDDWLHFEPDIAEQALMERLGIPLNQPIQLGDLTALSELLRRMSYEHYSAHKDRQAVVSHYFCILLYKLHELMQGDYPDQVLGDGPYRDKLLWIRTSVFRWPEQDWSAEVLAQELRLSLSRFQHLYTSTFGSTMLQDITSGRMQLACRLLETTQGTTGEIAERCGYASTSHFIKLFRKWKGMTPLQYRKSKKMD